MAGAGGLLYDPGRRKSGTGRIWVVWEPGTTWNRMIGSRPRHVRKDRDRLVYSPEKGDMMKKVIKMADAQRPAGKTLADTGVFGLEEAKKARAFHASFPEYSMTPLADLKGLAAELLRNPDLKDFRDRIGLDSSSRILCFSTEGDTDRENYRRIVWDGAYADR